MSQVTIRTALISVYDKSGVSDFAKGLNQLGVKLLSTGGTAELLKRDGLEVEEVSEYTGSSEILGGRVKTLHHKIHAGLLFRRDNLDDQATVQKMQIQPIDMVVVNLYPFEATARRSFDVNEIIENIDIGGPAMLRSAAKNYNSVAVVTDPADYPGVLSELRQSGSKLSEQTRLRLMLKAFERTAAYDAAISAYFRKFAARQGVRPEWPAPDRIALGFRKIQDLRYGENPHQKAAVFADPLAPGCVAAAKLVAGEKELSYTNILDADAALNMLRELSGGNVTVIIKHTNPCGAAVGTSLAESCRRALASDPVSAFGGVYAFSQEVDIETAKVLEDKFIELVLAPGFQSDALKILSAKKNRRILDISDLLGAERLPENKFRSIIGGMLYEQSDEQLVDEPNLKVVTKRRPSDDEHAALQFAWKIAKHVKSNAVVLCSKEQLVGVGAGQMSRVDSCKIALMKAREANIDVRGTVMASDAFLPFRDSVDLMGKAGVTAIVQPGGSIRDQEVIQAADEYGIAMLFTGVRHFAH